MGIVASVSVPRASGWTLLTNADTTTFTLQNRGPGLIYITATNGTSEPLSAASEGIAVLPGLGWENAGIQNVFQGSVNRLWAKTDNPDGCSVVVGHL